MDQKPKQNWWAEAFALVGVMGFASVMLHGWPTTSDPWTAIGAVATAAAALWLGWREGEWRRSEEGRVRRNNDLYMIDTLTAHTTIRECFHYCQFAHARWNPEDQATGKALLGDVRRLHDEFAQLDVYRIDAAMPEHAPILIEVMSRVKKLSKSVETISVFSVKGHRPSLIDNWINVLNEAFEMYDVVSRAVELRYKLLKPVV